MKTTMLATALILAAGLGAGLAQERRTIEYRNTKIISGTPGTFFFENSGMAFDSAVVKGAPYSADAVTETTQALADGNRIHRTSKAALYRDGEGRTRREQTLGELGPLTVSGDPIQTTVINDVMRALADPTRRAVFERVAESGEINVADLTRHINEFAATYGKLIAELGIKAE